MFMKTAKMTSFEKIIIQPSESFPTVDEPAKKKPKKIINKGRKSKKRLSGGKRKRTYRPRKKNSINDKLLEILIDLL